MAKRDEPIPEPDAEGFHEEAGEHFYDFKAKKPDAALLDDIGDFLKRFVAYPSEHARIAHVLWIIHTHLMDCWESTPRLAFLSPESGSGKTRSIELTALMVPNPIEAMHCTSAYLFRKIGDKAGLPTILFDEIDTIFGPKAKENEEMRGLLNAGHRRGASAGRCALKGKTIVTEELPAYCAVALAGLGFLPETIMNRSVVIRMRRRAKDEKIEPYRRRFHSAEGHALRQRIVAFTNSQTATLSQHIPKMPDGIIDRDADVWEALLSVADAAGGLWPDKSRVAAVALVALSKDKARSLGVQLLIDIKCVFSEASTYEEKSEILYNEIKGKISGKLLVDKLCNMIESPWSDLKGKPLTQHRLAQILKGYEVASRNIRIDEWTGKGYIIEDFADAWARYLPEPEPSTPPFP